MPRLKLLTLSLLVLVVFSAPARADVVEARRQLYVSYRAKLEELARRCDAENLPEAAAALRAWLPERALDQLTLFPLPSISSNAEQAGDPTAKIQWQDLRSAQSDALMELARQALVEHRPTMAMELVAEALRENPNQERARRMLGYAKFQGGWHTPFEMRQMRAGKVWHDRFGWLPKAHVARYERGQRFASGRWMPVEEEARLRTDLKRGWRVETDHYVVTTNHGLEEGVALARRLETFHGLWRQVFAPYLASEADLLKQLDGKPPRPLPRQHDVVYFRSRDEYNAALKAAQAQIDITLGIYFDTTRTAYFFAGQEQNDGTLYHEATHQLFQETRPVTTKVGVSHNFWIVEGIACYMESLADHGQYFTLGGANAGRMPAARHRLLVDNFYVPLAELTTLGREDLQHDQRIAMLYSQSAGLADFLMQADQGRYREPLMKYLIAIYAGRATPGTLAEATGESYPQLDAAYRRYQTAGEAVAESSDQAAR